VAAVVAAAIRPVVEAVEAAPAAAVEEGITAKRVSEDDHQVSFFP
jgi:hypothetical protein